MLEWIGENWRLLFECLGYLVAAGTVIAQLTKAQWDDKLFHRLSAFFSLGTGGPDRR